MENKIDYKWIVTIVLLGVCIYLQYSTMKRIPSPVLTDPLVQAMMQNQQKMDSLNNSIDSLDKLQAKINSQINKEYNEYQTNIYNSYLDNDSARFSNLSKDLDSMSGLWEKGYFFHH